MKRSRSNRRLGLPALSSASRGSLHQKSLQHILAGLVYALILGIIYFPVVAGHAALKTNLAWPPGPLFVQDPTAGGATTLPYEYLSLLAWKHLQWPAWDPFQAFGVSLWANQGVPFFVPELVTHLLFPHNYSIWNLLRLLIMAFGCYLLARSLGQSYWAAIVVGVLATLAGPTPTNINLSLLNPLMVFPYLLLSLRSLLYDNGQSVFIPFLGVVTSTALLTLSDFLEVLPLFAIVAVIYSIALLVRLGSLQKIVCRLTLAASGALAGGIVGAIGIVPLLQAVQGGYGKNTNPPTSYLDSVQRFWIATAFVPHLSGPAGVLFTHHFIQTVWTLGTPFLGLFLITALLGTLAHDRSSSWYVIPSVAISLFGVIAYGNIGGVLSFFNVFPFKYIIMVRFLEFAWWIPWCLLAGYTIDVIRRFSLLEILLSVLGSSIITLLLVEAYVRNIKQLHALSALHFVVPACVFCGISLIAVTVGLCIQRYVHLSFIAVGVVIIVTGLAVPRNFFPATGNAVLDSVSMHRLSSARMTTAQFGVLQLLTKAYSAQVAGAINAPSYIAVLSTLFPSSDSVNGLVPTDDIGQPTLFYVKLDLGSMQSLAQLGVNTLIIRTPLAAIGGRSVSSCEPGGDIGSTQMVCFLGKGVADGSAVSIPVWIYKLEHVDPLVAPVSRIFVVARQGVALDRLQSLLHRGLTLNSVATIVGHTGAARVASGALGISRRATTESVWLRVKTGSGGVVVLRESFLHGMTCFVNGRPSQCMSADGGLWTAVDVPRGVSVVKLGYVPSSDEICAWITVSGIILLLLAWMLVAGVTIAKGRVNRFRGVGGMP